MNIMDSQGASCRSAKRPGDQEGGARGTEHPLLNINGAKSSVNFYREGRTKKAAKASTFVNALASESGASAGTPHHQGPIISAADKLRALPRAQGSTTSSKSSHWGTRQSDSGAFKDYHIGVSYGDDGRSREGIPISLKDKRKKEDEAYEKLLYGDAGSAPKSGTAGRDRKVNF